MCALPTCLCAVVCNVSCSLVDCDTVSTRVWVLKLGVGMVAGVRRGVRTLVCVRSHVAPHERGCVCTYVGIHARVSLCVCVCVFLLFVCVLVSVLVRAYVRRYGVGVGVGEGLGGRRCRCGRLRVSRWGHATAYVGSKVRT